MRRAQEQKELKKQANMVKSRTAASQGGVEHTIATWLSTVTVLRGAVASGRVAGVAIGDVLCDGDAPTQVGIVVDPKVIKIR